MSGCYDLAACFSPEARQEAASARYIEGAGRRPGSYRRTRAGCCPLGLLLQADGYGARYRCPDADLAAGAIARRLHGLVADRLAEARRYRLVREAVAAFNIDWDAGEIADLAAALGVTAAASRAPEQHMHNTGASLQRATGVR